MTQPPAPPPSLHLLQRAVPYLAPQVVATSPIKYSVMRSSGHDTTVPTRDDVRARVTNTRRKAGVPQATVVLSLGRVQAGFVPSPAPDGFLSTKRAATTLPWSGTHRPATVAAGSVRPAPRLAPSAPTNPTPLTLAQTRNAAFHATYRVDNTVAGVPTIATSVKASLRKPWASPPLESLFAGRKQGPAPPKTPLGPGCYGVDGVVDKPDRPRSVCSVRPSTTGRFDDRGLPAALDVMYKDTVAPAKDTAAFQTVPSMRSAVPRFQRLAGVEQDEVTRAALAKLPLPDDRDNMVATVKGSALGYRSVFASKGGRAAQDPWMRELESHARARDAVLLGAETRGTIAAALADKRLGTAATTLRSVSPSRQAGRETGAAAPHLGPGVYLDGVVRADSLTRTRPAGSKVIPPTTTVRFAERLEAYKTLGAAGAVPDDSVLGHRPRSPDKVNRVNLGTGGTHDDFYRAAIQRHGPDVVYRTDVAGSPAASLATRLAHESKRTVIIGPPGGASPARGTSGADLRASPIVSRPTYLTQLEATIERHSPEGVRKIPGATTVTNAGRPALVHVAEPHRPSSYMASRVDGGRSMTVGEEMTRTLSRQADTATLRESASQRANRLATPVGVGGSGRDGAMEGGHRGGSPTGRGRSPGRIGTSVTTSPLKSATVTVDTLAMS